MVWGTRRAVLRAGAGLSALAVLAAVGPSAVLARSGASSVVTAAGPTATAWAWGFAPWLALDPVPTPGTQATSGTPLALAQAAKTPGPLTLTATALDALVLKAYEQAATTEHRLDPTCGLTWPVLAGIGRVESDNGRDIPAGGGITPDGTIRPPILGPALDGSAGFAAIPVGTSYARAQGPMQFIPSTWAVWGADGNHDGVRDVDNIFDASLGAANYLCAGNRTLTDPVQLAAAVFSYNHSREYVQLVLQLVAAYAHIDPAALLAGAHLQTLAPGGAIPAAKVTAAPPPPAASWTARALTATTTAGTPVVLSPLATAPAAFRTAGVTAGRPAHGTATAAGGLLRYVPAAGFVGTDRFPYAVAGHGASTATIVVRAAPGGPTPSPTPTPTGSPSPPASTLAATLSETVQTTDDGVALSGTDTAAGPAGSSLGLTATWTLTLTPTDGTVPTATLGADMVRDWTSTPTTNPDGTVTLLITATVACSTTSTCTAGYGPLAVTVTDGTVTAASYALVAADGAGTATATATATASPLPTGSTTLSATSS